MKVYVAGKAGREGTGLARNMIYQLEGAGHEVTLDWTMFAAQRDLSPHQRRQIALQMVSAVKRAEAVVLVRPRVDVPEAGSEPLGAYIEVGMALAQGKPMIALPGRPSLFWALGNVHQVENADEAVKKLEELNA